MICGNDSKGQELLKQKAMRYICNNMSLNENDRKKLQGLINREPSIAAVGLYMVYHIGSIYHQLVYRKSHCNDIFNVHFNADKPWIFGQEEQINFPVFASPETRDILFNMRTKEKIVLYTRNPASRENPLFVFWNNYYCGFDVSHHTDVIKFYLYNIINKKFISLFITLPRAESYNINQTTPYIYMTRDNQFFIYSLIDKSIKTTFSFLRNWNIEWAKDIGPSEYIIQAGPYGNKSIWLFSSLYHTLVKIHPKEYFFSSCSIGGYIAWLKYDSSEFLITHKEKPLIKIPIQYIPADEIIDTIFNSHFLNDHLVLLVTDFVIQKNNMLPSKRFIKVLNCTSQTLHEAQGISCYTNNSNLEPQDYMFSKAISGINLRKQQDCLPFFYVYKPDFENKVMEYEAPLRANDLLFVYTDNF
jgi:hypothetical protein